MTRMMQGAVAMMCVVSVAVAETASIGTAVARGDMRVDTYVVRGNATLFSGSVLETEAASADLRLDHGATVTLATHSRGTVYRDHMVLQQGESEIAGSNAFEVQASGVHIVAADASSRGTISLKNGDVVEVTALTGALRVAGNTGVLLGRITPGHAMAFAQEPHGYVTQFSGDGRVSLVDGHYYLTLAIGGNKYELHGGGLAELVGKDVAITGLLTGRPAAGGALALVDVQTKRRLKAGLSGTTKTIIAGVVVAAGVGLGVGVFETNKATPRASI